MKDGCLGGGGGVQHGRMMALQQAKRKDLCSSAFLTKLYSSRLKAGREGELKGQSRDKGTAEWEYEVLYVKRQFRMLKKFGFSKKCYRLSLT